MVGPVNPLFRIEDSRYPIIADAVFLFAVLLREDWLDVQFRFDPAYCDIAHFSHLRTHPE